MALVTSTACVGMFVVGRDVIEMYIKRRNTVEGFPTYVLYFLLVSYI